MESADVIQIKRRVKNGIKSINDKEKTRYQKERT